MSTDVMGSAVWPMRAAWSCAVHRGARRRL